MSVYVVSDIHGEYDRFISMLEIIDFSADDELYILGDVVDRGPRCIDILKYIMTRTNIHMMLGNHEHMCLRYYSADATETEIRRWNRNGNYPTLTGLDSLQKDERIEVMKFISGLPDKYELTVAGKKYYLVHGFTGEDTFERVWNRPDDHPDSGLPDDVNLIIGHTPVCGFFVPDDDEEIYVYSRHLTETGEHFRIYHAENFTDIDCCCGYGLSAARLGCLRLDDGEEFYT